MSTALDELFMAETMTDTVRNFAEQSAERSFTKVYEAGSRILPVTNEFTYDQIAFSRDLAPVSGPESPSKSTKPLGMTKLAGQVYKISEHVDLPATLIMMARGAGQTMPDPEGWLRDNLQNLTNRIQRTRNFWAAQSLHGATVDLGDFPNADVPTGTDLTYPIATLSDGDWSNPTTKIRSEKINTIKRTYRQNRGYDCAYAIASDTVEGYLTQNTELSNVVDGGGVATLAQRKIENSYLEGGTFMRVGGIDFEFARDHYATDAAPATAVDVISDSALVPVLPPRSRWFEAFAQVEGRQFIPSGSITSAALGNPLALFYEVRGWFAYLELITNPIGLRLHVGWAGNFVQKHSKAVLVVNTTP